MNPESSSSSGEDEPSGDVIVKIPTKSEKELAVRKRIADLTKRAMDGMGEDELEEALADAHKELVAATLDARSAWEAKGGDWDEEAHEALPMRNTAWSLRSGPDWTEAEKKELRNAKIAMVAVPTIAVGTVAASSVLIYSMFMASETADAKVDAETNSTTALDHTVNDNTAHVGVAGLVQSSFALYSTLSAAVLGFGACVFKYYDVCSTHSSTIQKAHLTIMADRDRVAKRIEQLQARLEAEQEKLRAVKAARRKRRKAKAKDKAKITVHDSSSSDEASGGKEI